MLIHAIRGFQVRVLVEAFLETMDRNKFSLRASCLNCRVNCCQKGHWQSPILDRLEVDGIVSLFGEEVRNGFKEVLLKTNKKYFIIDSKSNGDCFFYNRGLCLIQEKKPIDCACYPIKAINSNSGFIFVLDSSCPASKVLTSEFIKNAKNLALESVKRFDKDTYDHWLKHTLHWVKDTGIELKN